MVGYQRLDVMQGPNFKVKNRTQLGNAAQIKQNG